MGVVFFHIPKTGGTTLKGLIAKNNPSGSVCHFRGSEKPELSELQQKLSIHEVLYGHFRFAPGLAHKGHFLFTFMRDPVNRSISNFLHYRREGRLAPGPIMEQMEHFLSPEEVRQNGNFNFQTRWLAGEVRQKELMAQPEKHLELALKHLEQLSFVGLAEEFQGCAFMLCQLLGWKKWHFLPRNVHSNENEKKEFKANFGPRLEEINQLDRELYTRARWLFEKQKKEIYIPPLKRLEAAAMSQLRKSLKK